MPARRNNSILMVYGVVGVIGCLLIIAGALNVEQSWGVTVLAAGLIDIALVACTAPIALALTDRPRSDQAASSGAMLRMNDLLEQILNNTTLSEPAKELLFRQREHELLKARVEAMIAEGDFDGALRFCDELQTRFNLQDEAEALRAVIAQSVASEYESQVDHALVHFEHHLASRDWASASAEANRLKREFPDTPDVQQLDQRLQAARLEHKAELEEQFLDAASRDDIECAMGLLKQLDRYLSKEEGTRLAEVANQVVAKHRDQLGEGFRTAVSDKRWADAAHIGQIIVQEYPNTKMAVEVRSMLDVLRTRATQAAVAASS